MTFLDIAAFLLVALATVTLARAAGFSRAKAWGVAMGVMLAPGLLALWTLRWPDVHVMLYDGLLSLANFLPALTVFALAKALADRKDVKGADA